MVNDRDGFLEAVTDPHFNHSYWVRQAAVVVDPEWAAELLRAENRGAMDDFFCRRNQ